MTKRTRFSPDVQERARELTVAFIDAHRGEYGVEPIRALLPIAPSSD